MRLVLAVITVLGFVSLVASAFVSSPVAVYLTIGAVACAGLGVIAYVIGALRVGVAGLSLVNHERAGVEPGRDDAN